MLCKNVKRKQFLKSNGKNITFVPVLLRNK